MTIDLHDQNINRVLPFLVHRLHTIFEVDHMITSAETKFLFVVTVNFDIDLHEHTLTGFFFPLYMGRPQTKFGDNCMIPS